MPNNDQDIKIDGDRIRQLRQAAGLTQGEAAERAGLGDARVWWRIEDGQRQKTPALVLARMAAVLNVTVDQLIRRGKA